MGMLIHGMNDAIIFPLLYAYVLYPTLPGRPWLRGTLWGLALWLLSQLVAGPMLGTGFFASATAQPVMMVVGSFIGHFVYGAILGGMAGSGTAPIARAQRERRAA